VTSYANVTRLFSSPLFDPQTVSHTWSDAEEGGGDGTDNGIGNTTGTTVDNATNNSTSNTTGTATDNCVYNCTWNRTWSTSVPFLCKDLPTELPPSSSIPLDSHGFYATRGGEANLSIEMDVTMENVSFLLVLSSRPQGGEWEEMLNVSGGGPNATHIRLQEKIPIGALGTNRDIMLCLENSALTSTSSIQMDIVGMEWEEVVGGIWANKSHLSKKPYDYVRSPAMMTAQELEKDPVLLDWLFFDLKEIIHVFFTNIVQLISDSICSILFGDERPLLLIGPNDHHSIIETTRSTTCSWINTGFSRLRQQLKDGQFVSEAAKRIVKEILGGIVNTIRDTLLGLLGNVGQFIQDAMDWLVGGICRAIGTIGGLAADAVEFLTFGLVSSNSIRENVEDMVEGAESFWEEFEARVTQLLEGLIDVVNDIIDQLVDLVGEVIGEVLGCVINALHGLIDSFLQAANRVITGLVGYMLKGSAVSAVEYRETMVKRDRDPVNGSFVFEAEGGNTRSHVLSLQQEPAYISKADPLFLLSIGQPRGQHYTAPTSISEHPYETTWDVGVYGEFWVNVSSDGIVPHPGDSLSNHSQRILLNFSVPVTVFSGWALKGMDYQASNTLIDDLKTMFQLAWEKLTCIFEGVLHFIKKVADLFGRLLQEILSTSMWLIQTLEE
ncbi:MAG: hypothetical protein KAT70_03340, partial [Thermoplasmata archaeon]|nr:hypothetical protein [Thermoplasmata archaeon]